MNKSSKIIALLCTIIIVIAVLVIGQTKLVRPMSISSNNNIIQEEK